MLFRLVLISLVLGATLLLSALGDVDLSAPNSLVLFAIIGGTYLLTIIYALAVRRMEDPRLIADIQIGADLVTSALLVHVTGGAQSAYTFFFPLSIIGAATMRFRIGAVAVTGLSAVIFSLVAYLGWMELLPVPSGQRVLPFDLTELEFGRQMALNLAAFAGVGFLAFNLGGQIQRTSASLEVERTAAADLYAVHEDIVRSLASGLVTIDENGAVVTINEAACDILGVNLDSIGHPAEGAMPGIDSMLSELSLRESIRRADLTIPHEDGSALELGVSISPLRNNRDVVMGRIVNFQDLTELRQMEKQIKQAERLAVVGTLAAGIAHEIRNPLASISGSIELLNEPSEQDSDDEQRALMQIVTREVDRLNTLITDLLAYTNPAPPKIIRFDVADMVRETMQVFRQDRGFADVDLILTKTSRDRGLLIEGDPAKLRQVLWNLLRNAAEASGSNGEVTVSVVPDSANIEIEVADNGQGISSDDISKVFDPFFTTKSRGSGLGLATCHNIITELGGQIYVDSKPGAGTRFVIAVPIAPPSAAPARA
jgi:two-component system sensor histidine kinase PilS (NtrC family)